MVPNASAAAATAAASIARLSAQTRRSPRRGPATCREGTWGRRGCRGRRGYRGAPGARGAREGTKGAAGGGRRRGGREGAQRARGAEGAAGAAGAGGRGQGAGGRGQGAGDRGQGAARRGQGAGGRAQGGRSAHLEELHPSQAREGAEGAEERECGGADAPRLQVGGQHDAVWREDREPVPGTRPRWPGQRGQAVGWPRLAETWASLRHALAPDGSPRRARWPRSAPRVLHMAVGQSRAYESTSSGTLSKARLTRVRSRSRPAWEAARPTRAYSS